MGYKRKFYNPEGLAFREGEIWFRTNTSQEVVIHKLKHLGESKWDVYFYFSSHANERLAVRDVFSFQMSYEHKVDRLTAEE